MASTIPVHPGLRLWLSGVMLYAVGCALLALHQAFASQYLFADDARAHIFWMARFLDPRLFPHDPSADYFQSLAPSGFATLYWLLAQAGIDPRLASKLIPSVLSLIAVAYFFGLALRFFRSPPAAALGALLFTQCLWLNSDLCSATPRAFFFPLFLAFLYYQIRGAMIGMLAAIALEALFFPPAALLSLGVLAWDCLRWQNGPRPAHPREWRVYLLSIGALVLTMLCLGPYLQRVGTFGPVVTFEEARRMSEFGAEGRVPVFLSSWWGYWVGGNAGIHNLPTRPPWFLAAFLWPVLRCFPDQFPLFHSVPNGARPIPQIIAASLSLFCAAHLFAFHLYLPNRYTQAVTRVVLVLLAAGVLFALGQAAVRWAERHKNQRAAGWAAPGLAVILLLLAIYPLLLPEFPTGGYVKGDAVGLYRFFDRQPATIQIASLADAGQDIPLLCQRSNIIGAECAVPFHPGYYLPLRERGLQIARAQYSSDPAVLLRCLRDQKVDFWLLDRNAFSQNYWRHSRLLRQLRLGAPAEKLGEVRESIPFLRQPLAQSIAYQDERFVVLDAHRLLASSLGPKTAVAAKSPPND
ncbi:MAG: hypothetical protein H0T83_02160 [Chthoniobacterales bacterium]|nr:hypothetical protein [Chthoniobacterales bacterium]